MENIKERFQTISVNNTFTRIDPNHFIDLYIGLNEFGKYALKYRGKFIPEKGIKSVAGIEVNQYHNEEFNTLQFSLTSNDNKELFFTFCEDIIDVVTNLNDNRQAYKLILNRYNSWKKMFAVPPKPLGESEIMGLIGELLFLRDFLMKKYDTGEALKSWSGQDLTHKDFSYNDRWYEVKTIHSGKVSVRISSLEQLDSSMDGELVVYTLERMSASYDGIKINPLVLSILNSFELDIHKDMFLNSILAHGFTFMENYDEYVYELISFSRYLVNPSFPKLTKDNVNEAIVKVQYDLSLAMINNHIIEALNNGY